VQEQATWPVEGGGAQPNQNARLPTGVPLTFPAVYHAYFAQVLGWMRAMGVPQADMEDLAQEVFLVVRRKLPRFREGSLSAWIYKIAEHKSRNYPATWLVSQRVHARANPGQRRSRGSG
jgi:hypothetical protein